MSDPTFGLTPGHTIERDGQKWKTCSCGESILVGQVRDALTRKLNWRAWDALPVEHNGLRYYRKHKCQKD